jgi:hypothetical protein
VITVPGHPPAVTLAPADPLGGLNREVIDLGSGPKNPMTGDGMVTPQPPKTFKAVRVENAIKIIVTDRGRYASDSSLSSSVRFDFHWAADVDLSSEDAIKAGFHRSIVIASAPAAAVEDKQSVAYIYDPAYHSGFLYCTGVSAAQVSSYYVGPINLLESYAGGGAPENVEHLQVNESGEWHNGTLYSAIEWSCITPRDSKFAGIQFLYEDYPNLNQMSYGTFRRHYGAPGGSMQGKDLIPSGRRRGTPGTITISGVAVTGSGTEFLTLANAGDWIECYGLGQEIASVNSNTSITLAAPWPGPATAGVVEWQTIALVRIYCASVSKSGVSRDDYTSLPYRDVLLDGLLGIPNAPADMELTSVANGIRVLFPQVSGNGIKSYNLYRSMGTADTFSTSKTLIQTFEHDTKTPHGGTQVLWTDTGFTFYQQEIGQYFRYYVTTVNVRGQESTTYTTRTQFSRLADSGDTVLGRPQGSNLLWNPFVYGTNAAAVNYATDTTAQDSGYDPLRLFAAAGKPTWLSGWRSTASSAPLLPTHRNTTEILFPVVGVYEHSMIYQDVPGWDHATWPRVSRDDYIVFSVYGYFSGGVFPAHLSLSIQQVDASLAVLGSMRRRRRLSDDSWDETSTGIYTALSEPAGSVWRLVGVFRPDVALGSTAWVRPIVGYFGDAVGSTASCYVTRISLAIGTVAPQWSASFDPYWKIGSTTSAVTPRDNDSGHDVRYPEP